MSVSDRPVWFITGCATGFGRHLAEQTLQHGFRTVVTARNPADIARFESTDALLLKLDVTDQTQIDGAIDAVETGFGRIDVLVNNAGVEYCAAVEEAEDDQVRRLFDINVLGLVRMVKGILSGMRKRRSGFIVNLSSIGGLRSFPGLAYYNTTQFAVEGLSEALWQEVEPLGIKVMLVEPSGSRTDWGGLSENEIKPTIDDYAATAGASVKCLRAVCGNQGGDPVRAAQAILDAVTAPRPPHRLVLANNTYDDAMTTAGEPGKDFAPWKAVARGAASPSPVV